MEQSSRKLVAFLVIFEIALVICYGILGGYAIDASPVPLSNPAALYNGDGGQPQTTTGGESIVSDNSLPHFYQGNIGILALYIMKYSIVILCISSTLVTMKQK